MKNTRVLAVLASLSLAAVAWSPQIFADPSSPEAAPWQAEESYLPADVQQRSIPVNPEAVMPLYKEEEEAPEPVYKEEDEAFVLTVPRPTAEQEEIVISPEEAARLYKEAEEKKAEEKSDAFVLTVPRPTAEQEEIVIDPAEAAKLYREEKPEQQVLTAPPKEMPPPPRVEEQDVVLRAIQEAIKQYHADQFESAVSNLDYATQLIRQKKSERMKSLLPEPFLGWQAKEARSQALGTAVFGGGVTVSRDYFNATGATLSIEIVSDSPVLQSVIMLLSNPLFAGTSGGNLQTIKQQRAIIKYNDKDHQGEINIVVAGRFIVNIKGRNVDQAVLLRYAEAIDFEELAKN